MKKLFFTMVAMMMAVMSYGQNTLVATLNHDGNVSMYYGNTALEDAYNEAVDGDVITLSSGTFQSVKFGKAITLRGAGMDYTTLKGTSFDGNALELCSKKLLLEGLDIGWFSESIIKNTTIAKCRINCLHQVKANSDLTLINCEIYGNTNSIASIKLNCINCRFNRIFQIASKAEAYFLNCYLSTWDSDACNVGYAIFENCIFQDGNFGRAFPSTATIKNCICNRSVFSNISNSTNWVVDLSSVFISVPNLFWTTGNFTLTDEAKTKYIGTDGTEVGTMGGIAPYDPTPSNPQITKFNVARKTTADGKLSVDIAVNGAE